MDHSGESRHVGQKKVAKQFARGLRPALDGKRTKFYNRNRWTGKDEATSDASLLDLCHGILKPAFIRWVLFNMRVSRYRELGDAPNAIRGGGLAAAEAALDGHIVQLVVSQSSFLRT